MPRVKIEYIVSFSSEDPENSASNLLAWDVNKKKWLCSKGEPSCSVVLQLAKAVKICSVNIGAYQSALVEVLVGRSETPNDPFQVLVPSSVFQSPGEARRGAPGDADKVRSFAAHALAAAGEQRWDRLRVVCSQPYNKHCKFGLSFVHVFSEEGSPAPGPAPGPVPPPLDTFSSDEEFHPGELFAKHLQKPTDTVDTGAKIRQATSQALKNIPDSSIKLTKTTLSRAGSSSRRRDSRADATPTEADSDLHRQRDSLIYTPDDDRPHHKIDRVVNRHNDHKKRDDDNTHKLTDTSHDKHKHNNMQSKHDKKQGVGTNGATTSRKEEGRDRSIESKEDGATRDGKRGDESRKRTHSDKTLNKVEARSEVSAGPASSEPHALLADVVFVLSGYENPRRARVRDAAAALGALYRPDWGPTCTHLICAFPNTPKLRFVRASSNGSRAIIVLAEWIEETARTRRPLPHQWFATEPAVRLAPPPGWDDDGDHHRDPARDDSDTDDEIERVRHRIKKRRNSPPAPPALAPPSRLRDVDVSAGSDVVFVKDERMQGSVTIVESDSCGGSTDEGEERRASPPRHRSPAAALPALFSGRTFTISSDTQPPRARLIERYLRAYGGLVTQEPGECHVDYVVCDSRAGPGAGAGAGAALVHSAWVWRCHKERRLASPHRFALPHS